MVPSTGGSKPTPPKVIGTQTVVYRITKIENRSLAFHNNYQSWSCGMKPPKNPWNTKPKLDESKVKEVQISKKIRKSLMDQLKNSEDNKLKNIITNTLLEEFKKKRKK
jgi:hypothetical protein